MASRRALAVALTATMIITACSGPPEIRSDRTTFPADPNESVAVAIFLSNRGPDEQIGRSAIVFVAPDGTETLVETDKTTNGNLAFNAKGALFIPTAKRTYLLDSGKRRVWKHPERYGSAWAGPVGPDAFAAAFDPGTSRTDAATELWITNGSSTRARSASIYPDSKGSDSQRVYVRGDGIDFANQRLVGVTLRGREDRVFRWKTWGHARSWESPIKGDIFRSGHHLYFLEDVTKVKGERTVTYDGVHRSQTRVGSIDLRTGRYRSLLAVENTSEDRITKPDGVGLSSLAQSSVDGALLDGRLYWVGADARVISASVRTGEARVACTLDPALRAASEVVASWSPNRLDLLVTTQRATTLHRIDLRTCRDDHLDLPKTHAVAANEGWLVASSLARNPRAPRD